jgi:3-oxoacyl-[acyl-carrier protein] reductase
VVRSKGPRFEGRTAIVTGASRGIGRAIALQLASEGAAVVANARRSRDLDEVIEAIHAARGRAVGVVGDIVDPAFPDRAVDAAVSTFGTIDVVVNNATLSKHYGPVLAADREAFAATVLGNSWPQLALIQTAMRGGLGEGAPGAVVNISSIGPHNNNPWTAPYNAGKAAMERIAATLALELGPRNVRINVVAPGLVMTDLSRVFWEDGLGEMEASELPVRRIGAPEDVAQAVCFLASDDAAWITGVLLPVDGGRMLLGGEPIKEQRARIAASAR